MRTLFVGDVHGCGRELATLVERAAADRVVLVGDLYTKGPDPVGVHRVITQTGALAVLGNHDQRLRDVIAGRRPRDADGLACVHTLDTGAPGWREHLASLPVFLPDVAGFQVVHAGLDPSGEIARTTLEMAISMRRFPGTHENDPWWVDVYRGPPVVYGHDAKRGLVRINRDGAPWVVGLDSGCVYGKQLTGWIPETDERFSVNALRVYEKIRA